MGCTHPDPLLRKILRTQDDAKGVLCRGCGSFAFEGETWRDDIRRGFKAFLGQREAPPKYRVVP